MITIIMTLYLMTISQIKKVILSNLKIADVVRWILEVLVSSDESSQEEDGAGGGQKPESKVDRLLKSLGFEKVEVRVRGFEDSESRLL